MYEPAIRIAMSLTRELFGSNEVQDIAVLHNGNDHAQRPLEVIRQTQKWHYVSVRQVDPYYRIPTESLRLKRSTSRG